MEDCEVSVTLDLVNSSIKLMAFAELIVSTTLSKDQRQQNLYLSFAPLLVSS